MCFRAVVDALRRIILSAPVLILVWIFCMGTDPALPQGPAAHVAILTSYDTPPYQETSAGFQRYLAQKGMEIAYDLYPLKGDREVLHQALEHVKKQGARLLFTLGGLATEAALKEVTDLPIVACMILNANGLKGAANATGVVLEFPLETQMDWMFNLLPSRKSIGVLFNPAENGEIVEKASKVAQSRGRRLYAQEVRNPQDIPDALSKLSGIVDVLWGIPDHVVLSPETARPILLFSFRNRIPFTGLSESWVKAGALYSLDRDYADLGMQCGEMALKILQGGRAKEIRPASPRKVLYSLNLKTAEEMKLNIPQPLIQGASRVFQ